MRWLPLGLLLLLACHRQLPENTFLIGPEAALRLAVGDHARATRKGTDLFTFLEVVEDSRCPRGVQCIQAGRAVVRVAVLRDGQLTTETLTVEGNGVRTDAGTVYLQQLEPYPDAAVEKPEPYRLVLRLRE